MEWEKARVWLHRANSLEPSPFRAGRRSASSLYVHYAKKVFKTYALLISFLSQF